MYLKVTIKNTRKSMGENIFMYRTVILHFHIITSSLMRLSNIISITVTHILNHPELELISNIKFIFR